MTPALAALFPHSAHNGFSLFEGTGAALIEIDSPEDFPALFFCHSCDRPTKGLSVFNFGCRSMTCLGQILPSLQLTKCCYIPCLQHDPIA